MVWVDLNQSEQRSEEFFRHYQKGNWDISGNVITRDRRRDWIGEPSSSGEHQYPHYAFFFGRNPRGFNHSVDGLLEF